MPNNTEGVGDMLRREPQPVPADEFEKQEKQEKRHRLKITLIAAFSIFCLIVIVYLVCFPLPIYERYEYAYNHGEETPDILTDPNALAELHQDLIRETQILYETRRDEILAYIKDTSSPIYQRVMQDCYETLAKEYPGYSMGTLSWDIPEENFTLSSREADQLLYLYSAQYDWDFRYGHPDNFIRWLYGTDDMTGEYTIDVKGDTMTCPGHGGICMDQEHLNEARSAARKAVSKKFLELKFGITGTSVLTAIIPTAYADDTEGKTDEEILKEEYDRVMAEYEAQYGHAALDDIIWTNISTQLGAKIGFTIATSPKFEWSGTLEEYAKTFDWEIKDKVAEYSANPMQGRVVCEVTVSEDEKITKSHKVYYYRDTAGTIHTFTTTINVTTGAYAGWSFVTSSTIIDEKITYYTTNIHIGVFPVTPTVDFVQLADINASGIMSGALDG